MDYMEHGIAALKTTERTFDIVPLFEQLKVSPYRAIAPD